MLANFRGMCSSFIHIDVHRSGQQRRAHLWLWRRALHPWRNMVGHMQVRGGDQSLCRDGVQMPPISTTNNDFGDREFSDYWLLAYANLIIPITLFACIARSPTTKAQKCWLPSAPSSSTTFLSAQTQSFICRLHNHGKRRSTPAGAWMSGTDVTKIKEFWLIVINKL